MFNKLVIVIVFLDNGIKLGFVLPNIITSSSELSYLFDLVNIAWVADVFLFLLNFSFFDFNIVCLGFSLIGTYVKLISKSSMLIFITYFLMGLKQVNLSKKPSNYQEIQFLRTNKIIAYKNKEFSNQIVNTSLQFKINKYIIMQFYDFLPAPNPLIQATDPELNTKILKKEMNLVKEIHL